MNAVLLTRLHAALNGTPEMTLTEKAVDDTLLSYMRCALAPIEELEAAGWDSNSELWSLPMDSMSRLVDPVNFNTEAKVRSLPLRSLTLQSSRHDPARCW